MYMGKSNNYVYMVHLMTCGNPFLLNPEEEAYGSPADQVPCPGPPHDGPPPRPALIPTSWLSLHLWCLIAAGLALVLGVRSRSSAPAGPSPSPRYYQALCSGPEHPSLPLPLPLRASCYRPVGAGV